MDDNPLIYIVIPVFNEKTVLRTVIQDIQREGYNHIVIVDDCSSDGTYEAASGIDGVTMLRHKVNRGKGAATRTGIAAACLLGADIIITMDGDGQHDPANICSLVQPIKDKHVEIVLGSRMIDPKGMPVTRIIANRCANIMTWAFYRIWVTDSQSGFRAYSRLAADTIKTRADRYEYDSEVIREIRAHNLSFKEVPITVLYTDYSMGKVNKQGFINGIKTIYKMIWNLIT